MTGKVLKLLGVSSSTYVALKIYAPSEISGFQKELKGIALGIRNINQYGSLNSSAYTFIDEARKNLDVGVKNVISNVEQYLGLSSYEQIPAFYAELTQSINIYLDKMNIKLDQESKEALEKTVNPNQSISEIAFNQKSAGQALLKEGSYLGYFIHYGLGLTAYPMSMALFFICNHKDYSDKSGLPDWCS